MTVHVIELSKIIGLISSLYVCMAIKHIIVLFVETPRKFITVLTVLQIIIIIGLMFVLFCIVLCSILFCIVL